MGYYRKSLRHAKNSISYYRGQLDQSERKIFYMGEAHKMELKTVQGSLNAAMEEAKRVGEAHNKEVEKLQSELEMTSKADKLKYQSEAYSVGFLDYLRNFLAADPDYDWSTQFAPSTSGYMLKFKAENASLIERARIKLTEKIQGELDAAATEKAKKKEAQDKDSPNDSQMVSPSNTIVS